MSVVFKYINTNDIRRLLAQHEQHIIYIITISYRHSFTRDTPEPLLHDDIDKYRTDIKTRSSNSHKFKRNST